MDITASEEIRDFWWNFTLDFEGKGDAQKGHVKIPFISRRTTSCRVENGLHRKGKSKPEGLLSS